jgi:hypothetical protein
MGGGQVLPPFEERVTPIETQPAAIPLRCRRAMDFRLVDHDEISGRQGRILHHRAGGRVLLIEVGHARIGAASAGAVSRPKYRSAVLGVAKTRREDKVPQIGALQHIGVAIDDVAHLIGHRDEEIVGSRLSGRRTGNGSAAGRHDRRVLIGKIMDRGGVAQRLIAGDREDNARLRGRRPCPHERNTKKR